MAKEDFIDFTFKNKKFSGLSSKYIPVDFESDSNIILSLERNMESGESNRYRIEPNYFHDTWVDGVPLEINIVKDPCVYTTQDKMEISKNEIREISKWLTSSHFPEWLRFDNINNDNDATRYMGWFNNIETWTVGHKVYGLRLYFKATTPFAYTDDFTKKIEVTDYSTILVDNNSDELENYCYPTIEMYPNTNGQIFICNLSDCKIRENGTLELLKTTYFDSLLDILENHARLNGCTVEYSGTGNYNIVPLCNETAVQFNLVDRYDNKIKCTAFYLEDTKEYKIIEGGFMYMTVYKDLIVFMDCSRLIINDELGRMITYDKLGINDVDNMYWPKFNSGSNTLLLYGNCKFTIKHIESRKVGE